MEFVLKAGDREPAFAATVFREDGTAIDLTGATASLHMRRDGSSTSLVYTLAIDADPTTGKVSYAWGAGDTDVPGSYRAHIIITFASGKQRTVPNPGAVRIEIEARL